ncbi:MAG TPA: sulfurtransferase TusA family protein [Gammaproteobacteria bacterium]|nr:sulfurtransferase TusA family protein [Gammaproteobacteria bacterium]
MAVKFEKTGEGEYQLDVTGYVCPHPQMYTKKALGKMGSGDILALIFDNPSSGESIESMCESEGNELIDKQEGDGSFCWKIKKL